MDDEIMDTSCFFLPGGLLDPESPDSSENRNDLFSSFAVEQSNGIETQIESSHQGRSYGIPTNPWLAPSERITRNQLPNGQANWIRQDRTDSGDYSCPSSATTHSSQLPVRPPPGFESIHIEQSPTHDSWESISSSGDFVQGKSLSPWRLDLETPPRSQDLQSSPSMLRTPVASNLSRTQPFNRAIQVVVNERMSPEGKRPEVMKAQTSPSSSQVGTTSKTNLDHNTIRLPTKRALRHRARKKSSGTNRARQSGDTDTTKQQNLDVVPLNDPSPKISGSNTTESDIIDRLRLGVFGPILRLLWWMVQFSKVAFSPIWHWVFANFHILCKFLGSCLWIASLATLCVGRLAAAEVLHTVPGRIYNDARTRSSSYSTVNYGVLYFLPICCDKLMLHYDLPPFMPHLLSSVALLWLANCSFHKTKCLTKSHSPGRSNRDVSLEERVSARILFSLQLAIVLEFFVERFSAPNASIPMVDNASRFVIAYCLSSAKACFVLSPVAWFFWALQVLFLTYFPSGYITDGIILVIGLASLRGIRNIRVKQQQTTNPKKGSAT